MRFRTLPFLVLFAALCGCSELPKRDPAKAGPFHTPANVSGVAKLPSDVRRVLVLPAADSGRTPSQSLDRLDEAILAELNRTARFETTSISRDELRRVFGERAYNSLSALPPRFLQILAERHGVDAVLFSDLTQFNAYPPLSVGLRFKLARVSDQQILWAADNVFSASDPAVVNSARRHALSLGTDRSPGDLSHTILQHPTRFVGYAAAETFQTLPPR